MPVAIVTYLSLNAGKLTVPVRSNALAAQIAPGTTRNFFVVLELTANAAAQTPNTFCITHFNSGTGGSTASDAFSSTALTVEASAVTSTVSSISTAQINNAPTAIAFPNVTLRDTVVPTSVAIRNYFADIEDGAAGLLYEITGNTNPGLFAFAGIDSTGVLVIRYRQGIAGNSNVTVRAKDTLGKSVSSTFSVSVLLADTFGHWATANGGGSGPGSLLNYAFGMGSPTGGSVAGLPRMRLQGKTRVLSHLKPMWATDLTYQYEISQDMITWVPAIREVHFHEFSKDLPNAIRQSDCVLMVDWHRVFMRVRATAN
jgi:hypothetical protein